MKKLSVVLSALVLSLLMLACPAEVPTTMEEEDVVAVLALASPSSGFSGTQTSLVPSDSRVATELYSFEFNGPEGGSATFSVNSLDPTDGSFIGTVSYSNFEVEYEGAIYSINGSWSLSYLYSIDNSLNVQITSTQTGSVSISRDGALAAGFTVDIETTLTLATTDAGTSLSYSTSGIINDVTVNEEGTLTVNS